MCLVFPDCPLEILHRGVALRGSRGHRPAGDIHKLALFVIIAYDVTGGVSQTFADIAPAMRAVAGNYFKQDRAKKVQIAGEADFPPAAGGCHLWCEIGWRSGDAGS